VNHVAAFILRLAAAAAWQLETTTEPVVLSWQYRLGIYLRFAADEAEGSS
jgi:hypothetical protein